MAESVLTLAAEQWGEQGFIYRDGQVLAYEEDRKEQTYREFQSKPIEDFLQQDDLTAEVRQWAESCSR